MPHAVWTAAQYHGDQACARGRQQHRAAQRRVGARGRTVAGSLRGEQMAVLDRYALASCSEDRPVISKGSVGSKMIFVSGKTKEWAGPFVTLVRSADRDQGKPDPIRLGPSQT